MEYLKKNPTIIKNPKNIKLDDEENEDNVQEIKAGCCAGGKNKKQEKKPEAKKPEAKKDKSEEEEKYDQINDEFTQKIFELELIIMKMIKNAKI